MADAKEVKESKGCKIYNKANYPVTIMFNNHEVIIPPFARGFRIIDASKLGKNLPNELRIVKGE